MGKTERLAVYITYGALEEFAQTPIDEYRKRNPGVYLEMRHGFDSLCETAIDECQVPYALISGPIDTTRYDSELLFSTRYGIAVRKDSPFAGREAIDLAELDNYPLIVMMESQKTMSLLKRAAAKTGTTLRVSVRVDNVLLTHLHAINENCAGVTTESVAARFPGLETCFVPFSDPGLVWELYGVHLLGATLPPAAKALHSMFLQYRDARLIDEKLK
jgi:DNA-binding transcriptional LysR family regulator